MTTTNFRVSAEIFKRLGEELITSFSQGVVELAKNSYDANASRCTVELLNTTEPGGTIVIADDGDGMSDSEIRDGWLLIGRSNKKSNVLTRSKRLPAGNKGLGRLAALRMGEEVLLSTRSRDEPGQEHQMVIKWGDFAEGDAIEDVRLEVKRLPTEGIPGTRIEIRKLLNQVDEVEARRLARELVLLADPFNDPSGFKPELVASEFEALEALVRQAYFDECAFRLSAKLDGTGRATAKVFDRIGDVLWTASDSELRRTYRAPSATFELWAFLLNRQSFVGRPVTVGEIRTWLAEVGGIHLYHRGLRVRPYGDPGHDWLDMNLSRARSPELRPSTNNSVGRITVHDANEELLQKTDRTGFVENETFSELREFAIDALNWMQSKRLAAREEQRRQEKEKAAERSELAGRDLQRAVAALSPAMKPLIQQAVSEFESATASEKEALQSESAMYRTLASVGTSVSVFAHEIEGPARNLGISVRTVERRSRTALGQDYELRLGPPMEDVKRYTQLVSRFATLPLSLLRRGKRRTTDLDINQTIGETIDLFAPYLDDARVETTRQFCDEAVNVRGSVAAVEAIVSNLITNAVKAFKRKETELADRRLTFATTAFEGHVEIRVSDSGPGIDERLGDTIWLPGVTIDEDGTGLGLTIVRDTVADMNGQIGFLARGQLEGAEFIVEIPRARP